MKPETMRRVMRCGWMGATALMAVTSIASAQVRLCQTAITDPVHPSEVSCPSSCATPLVADCWGGAPDWDDATSYARGLLRTSGGVRQIRAYAFGGLEELALEDYGTDDYAAVVFAQNANGGAVNCSSGGSQLFDGTADAQYVPDPPENWRNCPNARRIHVEAWIYP